jgi:aminoglycoside 6'-N-acetyltransferase I
VIVRAAAPADSASWLRMRRALWPGDEHPDEIQGYFAGRLREPLAVLVAEEGGGLIGFVELSIRNVAEGCSSGRVAYLEGWWVEEAARRRGVGRALVAAAEDWGRSQGCTELASDTEIDNEASALAHTALGFDEVERIRCFRKPL